MECTLKQIEEKRKVALAKLLSRKQKSSPGSIGQNNAEPTNSPVQQNYFNPNTNSSTSFKQQKNSIAINNNIQQKNSFSPKANSSTSFKQHKDSPYEKKEISTKQFFGQTVTGTCALLNESRFVLNMSGYHEKMIQTFKSIPSRRYDPETKLWNFDLEHYDLVMSKMSLLQPEVVVGKLPSYVLRVCKKSSTNNTTDVDMSGIDPELLETLMPFQKEGVRFGIEQGGRCLIADEMGLGKTFQALAIACHYRAEWPLLIVTTASMTSSWLRTIQRYMPSVPLAAVRRMLTSKDYVQDAQILVVGRELMSRCVSRLCSCYGVLILDESHVYKEYKTKSARAAASLATAARRVLLLTGTPALSRPAELYQQLAYIDQHFFGGFREYSKRYCAGQEGSYGWDSSGKSNLSELEVILRKRFMIRRTKAEVLTSLPGKYRSVVRLDVQLERLTKTERECLNVMSNQYLEKKAAEKHSILLAFFAETARIKIPSVCAYVSQMLTDSEDKFLIFAHHQRMLDGLCHLLNNSKVRFIRIDGHTSQDQRATQIETFQNKTTCRVAVLSITAANAGITLTAAKHVLFAELHWNPSILIQAESRAHRIGQESEVSVRFLVARGTADDHIWPLLLSKLDVLNEAGLANDNLKDTPVIEQHPVKLSPTVQSTISAIFKQMNSDTPTNITSPATTGTPINISTPTTITTSTTMDCAVQDFFADNDEDDQLFANAKFDVLSDNIKDNMKSNGITKTTLMHTTTPTLDASVQNFFENDEDDQLFASSQFDF